MAALCDSPPAVPLCLCASRDAWQPHDPVRENEPDLFEPRPRFTGNLLPAQLKPPSQLELELAARSSEDIAAARAERMPWLTAVADKVRADKAAEEEQQRIRQDNLQRMVRGAALTGGVLGGAFSAARQEREEAERAALELRERKERELAKMRRQREKRSLR